MRLPTRGRRVPVAEHTPEWLAWRASGVTATDTAAILGLSPWNSRYNLWWEKRAQRDLLAEGNALDLSEPGPRFQWGLDAEPVLHSIFDRDIASRYGLRVGTGGCWQGKGVDEWLRATPDRLLYAGRPGRSRTPVGLVEFKTTTVDDGWGDPDDESGVPVIPVYYRAQMLHQMLLAGVREGWLTVLTSRMVTRHYRVAAQPGELEAVLAAAWAFEQSLRANEPPEVDDSEFTTDRLTNRFSDQDDNEVEVDADLAARYAAAVAARKAAAAVEVGVKNELLEALGNGRRAVCAGRRIASRAVVAATRLDAKALAAEQPEVYDKYSTTYEQVRLTPAPAPKPNQGTAVTNQEGAGE